MESTSNKYGLRYVMLNYSELIRMLFKCAYETVELLTFCY